METLLYSFFAGVSTVVGVFVLMIFGEPGNKTMASLLGFAAGAMVYIVNDELVPQSNHMHSHFANAGMMAGLLIGFGIL